MTIRLHVVSHTHWDREWYHTSDVFQQRLVSLVDALLERPTDASSFLLDGQAVLLEDYLAIRPERAPLLHAQLRAGTLEAGPWYVLADNLIPSGEAIVRNLEAGRRVLARFSVTPTRVAYCPDTFGHPSALPTIAQGFGFDVAIVWRGMGGRTHPSTDTVWWRGADDACVLAHHLPPDGYEFGSSLPLDAEMSRARWLQIRDVLVRRNHCGVMLLLNGADHHAAQPDVSHRIAALAEAAEDEVDVVASSITAFAGELLAAAQSVTLPDVRGELRDSYGYTWTLQGTRATRAAQKRRNAQLERALLRDVEPWIALASLHASPPLRGAVADGRTTMAQLPSLLSHAWETLLRTHPHDTLCGCSTDAVARAMSGRQASVHVQGRAMRVAALQLALEHDVVAAREAARADGDRMIIRNRVARARGGIAELRVLERIGDVRVGPGSAAHQLPRGATRAPLPGVPFAHMQQLGARLEHERLESPQHYPDDDLVRAHRLLAWIPGEHAVPAFGVRVVAGAHQSAARDESRSTSPRPVVVSESADSVVLDNGLLRLTVTSRGVTLLCAGRTWSDLLVLDSTIDAGDSYTPSLRGAPIALRLTSARVRDVGPLRASVQLHWLLPRSIGAAVLSDLASMTIGGEAHDERHGSVHVVTTLILDAESAHLRCDVQGVNWKRDHCLRIRWRTDVRTDTVWADAAFGPVCRTRPVDPSEGDGASTLARAHPMLIESVPETMPLHRWVSVADAHRGAALLSDGLADVEVGDGALVVTLLRAVGELSRHNVPERPGHAGWPVAIPDAQSLGPFRARLAVMPHGPWNIETLDQIEDACDALLLPLIGETWRDYGGAVRDVAGPSLEGQGLRSSSVTVSADGTAVVLRAVNIRDDVTVGAWSMPDDGPWMVTPCRIDETATGASISCGARINFSAGPRAVVTHRVRRADR